MRIALLGLSVQGVWLVFQLKRGTLARKEFWLTRLSYSQKAGQILSFWEVLHRLPSKKSVARPIAATGSSIRLCLFGSHVCCLQQLLLCPYSWLWYVWFGTKPTTAIPLCPLADDSPKYLGTIVKFLKVCCSCTIELLLSECNE
jgi:hypothetical protein